MMVRTPLEPKRIAVRAQMRLGECLARLSVKHPSWTWGPFRRLSQVTRWRPSFDPLDGAVPASADCELVGMAYINIFHAADAGRLQVKLRRILDQLRQLTPSRAPWEDRYAHLSGFLRDLPHTGGPVLSSVEVFKPTKTLFSRLETLWVSLFQPAYPFVVLCVLGVPSPEERAIVNAIPKKSLDAPVEWRLVLRPRLQVVPSHGGVSFLRSAELWAAENRIGREISSVFDELPGLLMQSLNLPCWGVADSGQTLASASRIEAYRTLVETHLGMWHRDWMIVGFGHQTPREASGLGQLIPRVIVDREAFRSTEKIEMYGNDVDEAIRQRVVDALPGVGTHLALRQRASELLPLSRELHCQAWGLAGSLTHNLRTRQRLGSLFSSLQVLLPRISELRAVASDVLRGTD